MRARAPDGRFWPAPSSELSGLELRRWRLAWGLTQREVGRRVGYAPAHVTMMERGRRAVSAEVARYVRAHPAPPASEMYAPDPAGLERALATFRSYAVFARWWGVHETTVRRWRYGEKPLPMPLRAWLRAGAPHHWEGSTSTYRRW